MYLLVQFLFIFTSKLFKDHVINRIWQEYYHILESSSLTRYYRDIHCIREKKKRHLDGIHFVGELLSERHNFTFTDYATTFDWRWNYIFLRAVLPQNVCHRDVVFTFPKYNEYPDNILWENCSPKYDSILVRSYL